MVALNQRLKFRVGLLIKNNKIMKRSHILLNNKVILIYDTKICSLWLLKYTPTHTQKHSIHTQKH